MGQVASSISLLPNYRYVKAAVSNVWSPSCRSDASPKTDFKLSVCISESIPVKSCRLQILHEGHIPSNYFQFSIDILYLVPQLFRHQKGPFLYRMCTSGPDANNLVCQAGSLSMLYQELAEPLPATVPSHNPSNSDPAAQGYSLQ